MLSSTNDAIDQSPWTGVFLCEDKASGTPIGTMRVQDNTRGGEENVDFNRARSTAARAFTRLSVAGRHR
jgi:hypothetical protein